MCSFTFISIIIYIAYLCIVWYIAHMKSIRIDVSDELHRALRIRSATDGIGMGMCVMGALAAYVGMELPMLEVVERVDVERKEPIKRLGVGLIPKDGIVGTGGSVWRTGACKKHGRLAKNGEWVCCPDA